MTRIRALRSGAAGLLAVLLVTHVAAGPAPGTSSSPDDDPARWIALILEHHEAMVKLSEQLGSLRERRIIIYWRVKIQHETGADPDPDGPTPASLSKDRAALEREQDYHRSAVMSLAHKLQDHPAGPEILRRYPSTPEGEASIAKELERFDRLITQLCQLASEAGKADESWLLGRSALLEAEEKKDAAMIARSKKECYRRERIHIVATERLKVCSETISDCRWIQRTLHQVMKLTQGPGPGRQATPPPR